MLSFTVGASPTRDNGIKLRRRGQLLSAIASPPCIRGALVEGEPGLRRRIGRKLVVDDPLKAPFRPRCKGGRNEASGRRFLACPERTAGHAVTNSTKASQC